MSFPFRKPINTEDPPEEDWIPPDYAQPLTEEDKPKNKAWKPPSYAEPIKTEEQKPSVFSRIGKAVTDTARAAKEDLGRVAGEVSDTASKFLEEHPKVREIGQRFLTGTSPEFEQSLKEHGITGGVAGPELAKVPGMEALGNKIREYGIKTGNYYGGAAGSVLGDLVSGAAVGFDPRAAGLKESPAAEAAETEELPIRRSREIPYKMGSSIQEEAPAPQAQEFPIRQEPKPNFVNPFEKQTSKGDLFEEAAKEKGPVKAGTPWLDENGNVIGHTTDTEGSTGLQPVEEKPLPIRSPNLSAENQPTIEEPIKPSEQAKSTEDTLYNLAREKFNMGKDLPQPSAEGWKPPSYATPEEPKGARTESGKLAIGADIKSLGKVLGTSLYKGDIAPIATKELLQNSIDAVRHLGTEGKVDVMFDQKNNIIHVRDNGKGLTKQELESVFTDLGASGKREDANAAGGFGLAKAAPLLGGKKVEVSSITKDANGVFHRHSFEGTPDELLSGVDIKHEIVKGRQLTDKFPYSKGEEPQTGTEVKVHVPEDSDFWSSNQFVENLAKHSPNVQAQIRVGRNYGRGKYNIEDEVTPVEKGTGNSLATLESPSATTELIIPKGTDTGSSSYIKLNLSNNGMYQGSKNIYFDGEIPGIPKSLTIDIRPKVPEGHADYPFTANREELRGSVEKQVKDYIDENVVKPGIGKRRDELTRLYSSMPEVTVGAGKFPNPFGQKISIYDPKGQITPGEMKQITSNSAFQMLAGNIHGTLKEAMKVAGNEKWSNRLEKIGIIFDDKLHGIHIPNPASDKSAILVNPFVAIRDMSPDEASANILHTILHEMAHVEPSSPGHNEAFTIRLGDIYAKFGARRSVEAQDQILKSIADPNTGIYNSEIQKILSTYQTSRGREATTEDLLTGTGIGSGVKGGGEGSVPESNKPNGEGVTNAVNKLFETLGNVAGKRGEQDAINRAERARRFGAFSKVKDEGVKGAAKSLATLRGEYEKVDPEKLLLKPQEADTLFTAIKQANITEGEKARGYTALFKLLNGEGLPQRNELATLDSVFGGGFADKITEMHGGIGAVGLKLSKAANTMKSMQNALSLAAPLRHGIGLVARKEFYPAFVDMFKFFANKEYYQSAMQALEQRPNYLLSREAGLFTAKPGSLLNSEEEFLNSYAGKIPLVRNVVGASQRGYTGFLNKLRADTFDGMIQQAKDLGYKSATQVGDQVVPTKETEAIARFINTATGRGDLGRLNKMTNELNLLLWSPRMIASRVQMFTSPKLYLDLPKGMRREGIKSLLGIAALGTAIDTLAAYGGAKISTNILSTDFGKSRFGTKLVDPWGGFQQYVVGAARFLAGKTDSTQPTTRLEIAGRFLANKESPAASLAHTLLTAKKFDKFNMNEPFSGGSFTTQYGEKTYIQSQIGKQFVPIFVQDLHDLMTTEPKWSDNVGLTAAMSAASLAGMAQDYPEKKKFQFRKLKLK